MIVCIDSGNTRIKWGIHDGHAWLDQGSLLHAQVGQLAALLKDCPEPKRVMLANVAGTAAAIRIRGVLAAWGDRFRTVVAEKACCGVSNLYHFPERLGVDRWCALIGARRLTEQACLVVMTGTATTVDALDAEGQFLGGMILPGLDAMRRSLAAGTADLPLAEGSWAAFPRNTGDAIVTGSIEASLGAIERAFGRLPAGAKHCLISGGNAALLGAQLVIPHVIAENLPLEGLLSIALETLQEDR